MKKYFYLLFVLAGLFVLPNVSYSQDTDGDGILDNVDKDDDNDGILDISEGNGVVDTDGDGIFDSKDIDSDNDGIPDNIEAQSTAGYVPPSGNDSDFDGLDNAYEPSGLVPYNTTGGGYPDYINGNADGDFIPDIEENGDPDMTLSGNDGDGDGLDDNFDDVNGTWDPNDDIFDPRPSTLGDEDGDVAADGNNANPLTNDVDYRDLKDTDGDGIPDEKCGTVGGASTIYASYGQDIYSINTQSGATSLVTSNTNLGTQINALASNADVGLVYYAAEQTEIYYWNPAEGSGLAAHHFLADLTDFDEFHGTHLYSCGGSYLDGVYYVGSEQAGSGAVEEVFAVQMSADGKTVISVTDLNIYEAAAAAGYDFDNYKGFGDLIVTRDGTDKTLYGRSGTHFWKYDFYTGIFSLINNNVSWIQLGANTNGELFGGEETGPDMYMIDRQTGNIGSTITTGMPGPPQYFFDLTGPYNTPQCQGDIDDDGDGILDMDEGNGFRDTDNDGIPDSRDLDSDNDGIPDIVEAQLTNNYVSPSGNDTDNDGLDNAFEGAGDEGLTPVNTDGADWPDYIDEDSDNDNYADKNEINNVLAFVDTDKDGLDDSVDATNGYADPGGTIDDPLAAPVILPDKNAIGDVDYRDQEDHDGDSVPSIIDIDDDNDGILDVDEGLGNTDIAGTIGIGNTLTSGASYNVNGVNVTYTYTGTFDKIEGYLAGTNGPAIYVRSPDLPNITASLTVQFSKPVFDLFFKVTDIDGIGEIVTVNAYDEANQLIDLKSENTVKGIYISQTGNVFSTPVNSFDATSGDNSSDDKYSAIKLFFPQGVTKVEFGIQYEEKASLRFTEMHFNAQSTDNDGIIDQYDLDADQDGIYDVVEAGHNAADANQDGIIDGAPAAFGNNGLYNSLETNDLSTANINYTISERVDDADLLYDFLDLDSDGDGIPDNIEAQATATYTPPSGNDIDNNGVDDVYDTNGTPVTPVNTDGDPQPDYLDVNSDNDILLDIEENGDSQNVESGTDSDGDGLDDNFDNDNVSWNPQDHIDDPNPFTLGDSDGDIALNGNDATPMTHDVDFRDAIIDGPDKDGDGIIDFDDIDDDNDGILDVDEYASCTPGNPIAEVVFFEETFGKGSRVPNPFTNYSYEPYDYPNDGESIDDGEYAIEANIPASASWASTVWVNKGDHTDGTGRMAIFNASNAPGEFYRRPILNITPNVDIKIEFWALNLDLASTANSRSVPNITATFYDMGGTQVGASFNTGDVTKDENWHQYSFSINPGANTQLQIVLVNNAPGGLGNDVALDDIKMSQDFCDIDQDGVPNHFDLDADDDGIYDVVEVGNSALDANQDGMIDGAVGANGLPDAVETAVDNGTINYVIPESGDDIDALANYLDLDSDGDGIPDNIEAQATATYTPPSGNDTDNNGVDDMYDTNGTPVTPVNTDGDALPDYLDINSDNDDLDDLAENGDADSAESGVDTDGDGIDDNFDSDNAGWDVNDFINDPRPSNLGDTDGDVAADGNNAVPMTHDVDFRDASSLLTSSGHLDANDQCNDAGTPGDPTDDFITFVLNPTGINLAANYTVSVPAGYTVSPASANYGAATTFTLNNGSAGNGAVNITITDNQAGGDTENVTITDPNTCSSNSNITDPGHLAANDNCNDPGTPGDPTDDFITFELNPTGYNLAADYTVTVPAGYTISPATGNYGAATTFTLNNGSAGNGAVNITITDNQAGGDTENVTITDPNTCSNNSNITDPGHLAANDNCNDPGTPGDPTDDFITFELNPTGYNLAAAYTVTVPAGYTISPATGNYGAATTFTLNNGSAGNGPVNITITDDQAGGDTENVTITDPNTCSSNSNITDPGHLAANDNCNDPGTPGDPTDDFITFELNPTGYNLAAAYTVTVPAGYTISPATGNYGAATTFTLNNGSAGNGPVNITITDNQAGGDTENVTITDPNTCSSNSNITDPGHLAANDNCNDPGTPGDPTDDFITFELNPTGYNLAADYTVTVPAGYTISPATGNYGAATTFALNNGSAGNGSVNITITDNQAGGDTENVTITDPNTCSSNSNLTSSGIANTACDNNGTPGDPTDDKILFDLFPQGNNLGPDYSVIVPAGYVVSPNTANYGIATSFELGSMSAGSGDVFVQIIDNQPGGDTLSFTLTDPGTCSDESNIIDNGLANVNCENNLTPGDPTDDYISFDLTPVGYNLGTEYTVTVPMGYTVTPSSGVFGTSTTFHFSLQNGSAGGGQVIITIHDNQANGDDFVFTMMDPGTCSEESNITNSNLEKVACNDNNTPAWIYDDYISFDLNPEGFNLGADYSFVLPEGYSITPTVGTYGDATSFELFKGSAGAGDVVIQLVDNQVDGDTVDVLIVDPGVCSVKPEIVVEDTVIVNLDTVTYCVDSLILPGSIVAVNDVCLMANGQYVNFDIDTFTLCVTYYGLEYTGTDTLCLELIDSLGNRDTITFNITCIPPPSGACQSDSIFINQSLYYCLDTSQLAGTIVRMENVCEDSTFVKYELIDSNFCVSYTGRELGNATACIVLTDEYGVTDTTYFCTEVVPYDGLPEANPDDFCVSMNTSKVYDILANDGTWGGVDSLYFLTEPMYGNIEINPDLTITYTPASNICERTEELIYEFCNPNGCV